MEEGQRPPQIRRDRPPNKKPTASETLNKTDRIRQTNAPFPKRQHTRPRNSNTTTDEPPRDQSVPENRPPDEPLNPVPEKKGDKAPREIQTETHNGNAIPSPATPPSHTSPEGKTATPYERDTTHDRKIQEHREQKQKRNPGRQRESPAEQHDNNGSQATIAHTKPRLPKHQTTDPAANDITNIKHNQNPATTKRRKRIPQARRKTRPPQANNPNESQDKPATLLKHRTDKQRNPDPTQARERSAKKADANQSQKGNRNRAANPRKAMTDAGKIETHKANNAAKDAARSNASATPHNNNRQNEISDTATATSPDVKNKTSHPPATTKQDPNRTTHRNATESSSGKQPHANSNGNSTPANSTTSSTYPPNQTKNGKEETKDANANTPKKPPANSKKQETSPPGDDKDHDSNKNAKTLDARNHTGIQAAASTQETESSQDRSATDDRIEPDIDTHEKDGQTKRSQVPNQDQDPKLNPGNGHAQEADHKNKQKPQNFNPLPNPNSRRQHNNTIKKDTGK
ncbi:hypothetical protein [Microvirga guangxiensis]|uniref:hypothetical protein n=1 Tax=Microvirga guangxiensis TaxID=549386 RepID=UPI001114212F|nr:hypothetical protein [Microvirga guangxiensis]